MMKENESRIFEFQIAKKLISEQNYSGIRLRKVKTYVEDEVSAEAAILAQSTSEYQPIKELQGSRQDFKAESVWR